MFDREEVTRRALESYAREDFTGWFEELYRSVDGDWTKIPWTKLEPNPHLVAWLAANPPGKDRTCLVVGCGLGDDAEALAAAGYEVTAFDIAPTAIEVAKRRFAKGTVRYEVADALAPPASWAGRFGLIFESYTLQALPEAPRLVAIEALTRCVAPGGRVLVVCRGRVEEPPASHIPFPLLREDLSGFVTHGLVERSFEDYYDDEDPPVRRFRIEYLRPPS